MPDIKLFKVHSYADLHGFKDVPIVWFVDKRERRLFGPGGSLNVQVRDVLPNYTGSYHDYDLLMPWKNTSPRAKQRRSATGCKCIVARP